jgi:MFS family permease
MTDQKNTNTIILVVASISVFFEALDIAIINLAMPVIQNQFGLSAHKIQWLQTLYVLLYGGFLIVGGKLSDVIGRKYIFLTGSGLFLFTSLGAGLSTSFEALLICRGIQGLAAALVMPSALSILTTTFAEAKERSKAIGIFSAFAAIGSGSGLSIGGLITTYFGWQWTFFINVPVILLTFVLGIKYIRHDRRQVMPFPDVLSGALLTSIIISLCYFVHELANLKNHLAVALILSISIICGTWIFIQRNANRANPLLRFSILANSITGVGVFVLLGAFFTGYLFLISLILQQNLGFSAARSGLLLFPFSLLSALVGKLFIPLLLRKFTITQTSVLGMISMALGALMLILAMFVPDRLIFIILSIAFVNGIGMAICFTALMVMTVQPVAEEHHGLASSVASTAYFVGGGIGLSTLSIFINDNIGPSKVSVVPVVVLATYAIVGTAWLSLHSLKMRNTKVPSGT